jgi:hypothetical protein
MRAPEMAYLMSSLSELVFGIAEKFPVRPCRMPSKRGSFRRFKSGIVRL